MDFGVFGVEGDGDLMVFLGFFGSVSIVNDRFCSYRLLVLMIKGR